MKKIIFIALICLGIFTFWYYQRYPLGENVVIGGHTIHVELAITNAEKEKGLGYRDSLPENSGMLFVFQNKDKYGFWMKGMRFPLDFIWIDGNKIVDLSQNIPNPAGDTTQPVSLAPSAPADKVLEVNAGVIQSLGVHIGDTVLFTD
jgi:uncharacterized membrane protein (UPF0127 family)